MQKRSFIIGLLWVAAAGSSISQAAGLQRPSFDAQSARTVLQQYCVTCHNDRLKTGGLTLDPIDLATVGDHGDVWEKVVRKLRTGTMPPPGVRRPDDVTYSRVAAWLESELDRAASARPNPGRPILRRLNRAEYANAVRDLLALEVPVASLLPPDDAAYGFDNISDVLNVSPSLQERYLAAAEKISEIAVGDPDVGAVSETYRVRGDLSQNQHIDGLPLGTVGGTIVRHMFQRDGEYVFKVELFRTNFDNPRGIEQPHQFELTVDGERVHGASIGGSADLEAAFERPEETADAIDERLSVRVPVRAGPHDVALGFVENASPYDTMRLRPFLKSAFDTLDWTGRPHVRMLTITGPFNATGPGDTPSRRKIFVCRPPASAAPTKSRRSSREIEANEGGCARQIVTTLAKRAYRQPVTDADLRPLLDFYRVGRSEGSFDTGIERALQLILSSPKFIFRIEGDGTRGDGSRKAGRATSQGDRSRIDNRPTPVPYRVSDVELASRLSFFLWSSAPDEELITVALKGGLNTPSEVERQVRRMLADPKAAALVNNFAGQWLRLRNVQNVAPNSDEFPDFDDNLRQAFRRETELLFQSVVVEDRSVLDLLRADYTFVNERLARHYGIPNVYGSHFRRVPVTVDARKGLLGHGSVLTLTSHATRTSPVLRGKWILDNLLGTPPPPPPGDVPALKENEKGQKPRTVREQMAEHRADPVCASCHRLMDPIGFALENYDAVGAWRAADAGTPIDASGELADGTRVDGVVTLREALLKRPQVLVGTMTEKLLTYALGRGLESYDMPAVRAVVREAAGHDYRFSSLILGIVRSTPFQMRMKSENQ